MEISLEVGWFVEGVHFREENRDGVRLKLQGHGRDTLNCSL